MAQNATYKVNYNKNISPFRNDRPITGKGLRLKALCEGELQSVSLEAVFGANFKDSTYLSEAAICSLRNKYMGNLRYQHGPIRCRL